MKKRYVYAIRLVLEGMVEDNADKIDTGGDMLCQFSREEPLLLEEQEVAKKLIELLEASA